MRITLSVIKVDIGSIGGHIAPSDELLHTVRRRIHTQGDGLLRESDPEPCRCGGLVHAAATGDEDADGNLVLVTGCDVCGRSEDQLDDF